MAWNRAEPSIRPSDGGPLERHDLLVPAALRCRNPRCNGRVFWHIVQGCLAEGLQRTSAGLGSVIIDSQPLTVTLLAALLFGERIRPAGVLGLLAGVAGLCLLELPPDALRGLVQGSTTGVPAVQRDVGCPAVPAGAATGGAGVAWCRNSQQVCLSGLPPNVPEGLTHGAASVRGHAARGVLPWLLSTWTPAVCACRWAGLLAARRRLALGQRGLVDAALGAEHGCGDHHGQMGVQVSRPADACLQRTLQLCLLKPEK